MGWRQNISLSGRNEFILLSYSNLRFLVGLAKGCYFGYTILVLFFDFDCYLTGGGDGKTLLILLNSSSSIFIYPSSGLESEPDSRAVPC